MADDVDIANDRAALAVEAAISCAHEAAEHPSIGATGYCLNCGEPVEDGRRWCGAPCRDDWQRANIKRYR